MTVSTAYAPITYAGNGATTAFSVTWPFLTGSLIVTSIASTGVETVKTLTTHYTVTGGTDANGLPATGTVTMLTAPASGETLRITRATPKTQTLTWGENDAFPQKVIESGFDKLLLIAQEGGGGGGDAYDEITGDTIQLVTSGATDYWDGESHVLKNLATGTDDGDAATYGQLSDAVLASGNWLGSTGATDNRLLRADGTGGATIQNSPITVDDSGNLSTPGRLEVNGASPEWRLRDTGASISGGGLVRWAGLGNGKFQYQINTAAGGDFGTIVDAITVTSDGRVGIGSASPTYTFEVDGTALVNATLAGASTSDFFPANYINATDTVNATGASDYGDHAIGLAAQLTMANGAGKGNRHGLLAMLVKDASTGGGTTGTKDFYHGIFGKLVLTAAGAVDGGTAPAPYGNHYGGALGIFCESPAGATYWNSATGLEVDLEIPTNVNLREKIGVAVVLTNDDLVQGSVYDAAVGVHADGLAAHPGWKCAFSVGKPSTRWPLDTTAGTILGVDQAGSFTGTVQCKYGVDFNGVTFTDFAFRSNGFSINPTGGVACSAALISYNGLALYDSDTSHILTVTPGTNLTANRTLTLTTGDADQNLRIDTINNAWTAAAAPTVTASSGTYTSVAATLSYRQIGKTVEFRLAVTITTNGTAAATTLVALPWTAQGTPSISGSETASTGNGLSCYIGTGTSTLTIRRASDGSYAGANGYVFSVSGTMETT